MTDFEKKYLELTKKIILENICDNTEVFLFGSRAKGTNSQYSDIDVGFISNNNELSRCLRIIADKIEETRIPFAVDLVDFAHKSKDFQEIALKRRVVWKKKKS